MQTVPECHKSGCQYDSTARDLFHRIGVNRSSRGWNKTPTRLEKASCGERRAEQRSAFRLFSNPRHTRFMPEYRRNRVPGVTFVFTLNLLDRRCDLLVAHVDVLREAVRRTRLRSPFRIAAWVVLPDHMRCPWTPAFERVKELKDGWVGTMRPSRQPRCGFLRMRRFLNAINNVRHGGEGAPKARLEPLHGGRGRPRLSFQPIPSHVPAPGQAPAARRCRLPGSLPRHQDRLCEILAERRAEITGHDPPRRARDLAATVLGTYDPRRTGFRRAHGPRARSARPPPLPPP